MNHELIPTPCIKVLALNEDSTVFTWVLFRWRVYTLYIIYPPVGYKVRVLKYSIIQLFNIYDYRQTDDRLSQRLCCCFFFFLHSPLDLIHVTYTYLDVRHMINQSCRCHMLIYPEAVFHVAITASTEMFSSLDTQSLIVQLVTIKWGNPIVDETGCIHIKNTQFM